MMAAASSIDPGKAADALAVWRRASQRDDVVDEVRSWLGTPYHHQASLKHVGCDCLGLLRGVWRGVMGPEPEAMVPYTPDWGTATGDETLLDAARRHLVARQPGEAIHWGDVLVFRMRRTAIAKHCGILVSAQRFVHAYEKAGVVEVNMSDWWRRHTAGVFAFPVV